MNIKHDAIMRKRGITDKDLFEAEDKSDQEPEKEVRHMQKSARKKSKPQKIIPSAFGYETLDVALELPNVARNVGLLSRH